MEKNSRRDKRKRQKTVERRQIMAKKKNQNQNQRPELKPQNSKKVNEILEGYNLLSEHDKGVFLQKGGVFFLHHHFQPLYPTMELRSVISSLAHLSYLINIMMRWAAIRRIDVEELAVISRSKMEKNTIQPVIDILQEQCRQIEGVLFNDYSGSKFSSKNNSSDASSGEGSGEKMSSRESSGLEKEHSEEPAEEPVSQTDHSDEDGVFELNTAADAD